MVKNAGAMLIIIVEQKGVFVLLVVSSLIPIDAISTAVGAGNPATKDIVKMALSKTVTIANTALSGTVAIA